MSFILTDNIKFLFEKIQIYSNFSIKNMTLNKKNITEIKYWNHFDSGHIFVFVENKHESEEIISFNDELFKENFSYFPKTNEIILLL